MAICKLCLEKKTLLKKSHIIPEFMYKDLYDENHKMRMFSPQLRAEGKGYINKPSSGEYEAGILCKECDNGIIGGYENYASRVMYGGKLNKEETPEFESFKNVNGVSYTVCRNVDYSKFKLFLLSVLWRAGISSRSFFSEITLGPHEEILREMILNGNPGELKEYPVFFMTFSNDKSMPTDLVAHPRNIRTKEGHRTSNFIIGGLVYMFYVNSRQHRLPKHVLTQTIKPTNEVNVIHIPEGKGWDLLLGYYGIR